MFPLYSRKTLFLKSYIVINKLQQFIFCDFPFLLKNQKKNINIIRQRHSHCDLTYITKYKIEWANVCIIFEQQIIMNLNRWKSNMRQDATYMHTIHLLPYTISPINPSLITRLKISKRSFFDRCNKPRVSWPNRPVRPGTGG